MRNLYRAMLVGLFLLALSAAAFARPTRHADPRSVLSRARAALKARRYHQAIEVLSKPIADPAFRSDPTAPAILMTLAEASEAYVRGVNGRYWKRSRLDPRSPGWLSYLREEQHWADRHYASFEYFEPRSRYRYEGDAYKLLLKCFPKHPLSEEAAWRLIPREDDGEHHLSVDPALEDAARYERFLRKYPRSKHHEAAKLSIGWDYVYASGITWGDPDQRRLTKGIRILQGIVREAPRSPEARKAQALLAKAKNPFGYQSPRKGS